MASKLIGIVGETSTGKSTSIKHLNPDETYIINVAKKELPFISETEFASSKEKIAANGTTIEKIKSIRRITPEQEKELLAAIPKS